MRLILAALVLAATPPALADDLLLVEPIPQVATAPTAAPAAPGDGGAPSGGSILSGGSAPSDGAAAPAGAKPAPPPYAGIYDAPVFGRTTAAATAKVDESALRFYAAQKNHTRVEAEIRRLRLLHPNWKVPSNLYSTGTGNDEQPLWDLFAAGRLDDLRSAIQAREQHEAGWRPSADLITKMARRDTSTTLESLSKSKDWAQVLETAAAHPDVMSCASVDIDWRVAEAFDALGLPGRAFEVDAAILQTCKNRDERLATVRKAVGVLPDEDVEKLIGMGQVLADGSGEFDAARLDLARSLLGQALSAPAVGTIPEDRLGPLGEATLRSRDPADAALLGWYHYGRAEWTAADGWFKLGLAGAGHDSKLVEGHALALGKLGHTDEAEQLADAWRDRSPVMRALFVGLVTARLADKTADAVEPREVADFTALVTADKSAAGAEALAWHSYDRKSWAVAAEWFKHAVDWAAEAPASPGPAAGAPSADGPAAAVPAAGAPASKAVEGYALTLEALGRSEEAEDLVYAHKDESPALRDLFVSVAIAALTATEPHPETIVEAVAARPSPAGGAPEANAAAADAAAAGGAATLPISPERMARFVAVITAARAAPGAAALGWYDLGAGRAAAAVDWFGNAKAWSKAAAADSKTAEGLVLALARAGRLAEAEQEAYPRIDQSKGLRDAYRAIMLAELVAPGAVAALTGPRLDRFAVLVAAERSAAGAEAIGWFKLQDSRCGYAADWFARAIDWSPDQKGSSKAVEGYATALLRLGAEARAATIAFAGAERAPDLKALYLRIMLAALAEDHPWPRVDAAEIDRFAGVVAAGHVAAGAEALGWYRYRDPGQGYGVAWFADALAWTPDGLVAAKTVEGYASALRDVGRLRDAEAALSPWAERDPTLRDLYLDVVVAELTLDTPPAPLPDDRLARFVAVASPIRSATAAQALGWYRYGRHDDAEAVRWFKTALDWWPADTVAQQADTAASQADTVAQQADTVVAPVDPWPIAAVALRPEDYRRSPRAFASRARDRRSEARRFVDTAAGRLATETGYALALRAAGRRREAEDVAFEFRDRSSVLARLFGDLAIEALTRPELTHRGEPPIEPARLARFAALFEATHDAAGAAALGWYASGHEAWSEAVVWLKAATDWRAPEAPADPNIVTGYIVALRQAGRPDEAYAVAAAWRDRAPGMKAVLLDTAIDLLGAAGVSAAKAAADAGGSADAGATAALPAERLAEVLSLLHADAAPRSAAALGWYYTTIKQAAEALPWFKAAITRAGSTPVDPKAVEGYALALRALGRDQDAVTFMEAWQSRVPALRDALADSAADLLTRDKGAVELAPDLLARLAKVAEAGASPKAAAAFGWYAFAHQNWAVAADWFRVGIERSPDPKGTAKLVEGYASSLRALCRLDEAADAAAAHLDEDADGTLRRLSIDAFAESLARQKRLPALEESRVRTFAATVVAAASANGAQALGWYSYRARQYEAAAAWFDKAVGWDVTEGSLFGLAMAHRKLRDPDGVNRVLALYEGRFPALDAVRRAGMTGPDPTLPALDAAAQRACGATGAEPRRGEPVALALPEVAAPQAEQPLRAEAVLQASPKPAADPPLQEETPVRPKPPARHEIPATAEPAGHGRPSGAAAALAAKDYGRCLALLDQQGSAGRASQQMRGWCLLGLNRPEEAAAAFRAGAGGRNDADSALGESLSLLRSGDTGAAAEAAGRATLSPDKRKALGVEILEQQAFDAYKRARWAETLALLGRRGAFASETRDLMMLRGWSLYHLGDYEGAHRVFLAVDRQISDAESRKALSTVTEATSPKAQR